MEKSTPSELQAIFGVDNASDLLDFIYHMWSKNTRLFYYSNSYI